MNEWTEVRRKVLVEGVSKRSIRRDYKIGSAALEKILANSEPPGYRQQVPRPKPQLGQFLGVIDEILEADKTAPPKQRHTARRIYERLRDAALPPDESLDLLTKLAAGLPDRAHCLGIRAAFVAGDEVYSGRELRRGIRQRGMGYVLAVRANHTVTTGSGRNLAAAAAAGLIPARAWHRMRTGSGTKGTRHYDWAMLEVTSDDTPGGQPGGHSVLLARRHRYTGTLSFCRCWTPGPVPLSRLIVIAVARWRMGRSPARQAGGRPGRRAGHPLEVLAPLDRGLPGSPISTSRSPSPPSASTRPAQTRRPG